MHGAVHLQHGLLFWQWVMKGGLGTEYATVMLLVVFNGLHAFILFMMGITHRVFLLACYMQMMHFVLNPVSRGSWVCINLHMGCLFVER